MAVTGVAALAGTGTQTNASVSSAAAVVQQDADVASVSSSFCHHRTLLSQAGSCRANKALLRGMRKGTRHTELPTNLQWASSVRNVQNQQIKCCVGSGIWLDPEGYKTHKYQHRRCRRGKDHHIPHSTL